MELGLRGKRALITGASKGIGYAVAEVFAEEGCNVDMASRDPAVLEEAAQKIRSAHQVNVRTFPADLSREDDRARLLQACGDDEILVNNAGSNPAGALEEIDDATWRASWDLKVFGYINMTRAFYARMKARRYGVIVNVIGTGGERMDANYILGASGNIALMGFTRALGGSAPDHNVRVLAVNPGLTETDRAVTMLKVWSQSQFGTPDRWREALEKRNLPFGRMGTSREVADAVVFLASGRSGYTSGTVVTVDGGNVHR
jgi:NAD(P)-dependent dehydrogenase (short-subunit alcohol dehydrogenase family)